MSLKSENAIEVIKVSKRYHLKHIAQPHAGYTDDFYALNNVSFTVRKGEAIGIIGNNGSGKSTLLKILSQITRPSGGEVHFYGSVTSILEIGTNFHPDLTGMENVDLHLRLAGLASEQLAVRREEILAYSEIGDFFYEPVKVYSSGMFLRLAFAMAFHLQSDIFLLDEVISVGDEGFRLKCQDMLKQLQQQGKTLVFVSHNRLEILELSERCIWLDKGSVRRDGNSATVMSEYFALHRDNYDGKKLVIDTHPPQSAHTENPEGSVFLEWDAAHAPGNDVLAIRQLSVQPAGGTGRLLSSHPVRIRFVIDKKKAGIQIGAFFFMQDVFYQPVMVAHFLNNTDGADHSRALKDQTGLIEITCTIPAHFLLPGKYYLLPRFGMEEGEWNITSEEAFRFEDKLNFTLHAPDDYVDVTGDVSKGSVRPPLPWRIEMMAPLK